MAMTRERPVKRGKRRELLGLLVLLLLAWLVVYPLVLVLGEAVGGPGAWTLEAVRRFGREGNEWRALFASIAIIVASRLGPAPSPAMERSFDDVHDELQRAGA